MGIDDVPVMSLTLWTDDPQRGATELAEVAHTLETEIKRVPGTRDVYTIGAPDRAVVVDAGRRRAGRLRHDRGGSGQALQAANVVRQAGERVGARGRGAAHRRGVPADAQQWPSW
jgi:multidrug efflux pump subunit AcrB